MLASVQGIQSSTGGDSGGTDAFVIIGVALVLLLLVGVGLWWARARGRQAETPAERAEAAKGRPQGKQGREEAPGRADRPAPKPAPERPRDRTLQVGLSKTRGGFIARIAGLLGRKQMDDQLLDELEESLLTADIGVKTSQHLFQRVKDSLSQKELADGDSVFRALKEESKRLLQVDAAPLDWTSHKPFVLLVIGVNGAGKTTTIGKLAAQQVGLGRKVVLAAGDTFRAAATEQLEEWGRRSGATVVKGKEGGDPSAVIFDAVRRAQQEGADVVIADTAGRLHVKAQLMEELQKVRRVLKKADPSAPHETWLVLDSTNGQNAIAQAATFKEAMEISGIVLTKLDGTAKGGVILGICNELQVPVRYIGIGEKVDDLRTFDATEFVEALYDREA